MEGRLLEDPYVQLMKAGRREVRREDGDGAHMRWVDENKKGAGGGRSFSLLVKCWRRRGGSSLRCLEDDQ